MERGTNAGREVEAYLSSTNLGPGHPWCAAFVHWNFRECGRTLLPAGPFAAARHWATKGEVYRHGQEDMYWDTRLGHDFQRVSMDGDCGTLWYSSLGRIGHVFLIIGEDEDYLLTVEGNTSSGGSRDGDGVYKRKRMKSAVHTVNRWWE